MDHVGKRQVGLSVEESMKGGEGDEPEAGSIETMRPVRGN